MMSAAIQRKRGRPSPVRVYVGIGLKEKREGAG
jgi:hypothetical protein